MRINSKKLKQIKGMTKGEGCKCIRECMLSFALVYSLIFATAHYFLDADSLILCTYGVVLMEILASVAYCILHIIQYRRDLINQYLHNTGQTIRYKISLLDKRNGVSETISGFKICFFLIITIGYLFVNYSLMLFTGKGRFMDVNSAFDYVMFFISIAYFDIYWDGGYKQFVANLKNIIKITKDDNFFRKIVFYIILIVVAVYQIYAFISDMRYGIALL